MATDALTLKIQMLERQLAEIKTEAATVSRAAPRKTFGDLYGICADGSDITFEEIQSAKYQANFDWLDEGEAEKAA